MSTQNPTLDAATFSKEVIQETVRPGLAAALKQDFDDPHSARRGTPIDGEPGDWPPLVVSALPGGGRVLYPHVVVTEDSDSAGRIDARHDLSQHTFAVQVQLHGTTSTQMYNLRGIARGYFLSNRETLRDAGFAEIELSGQRADWDPTSKTASWELTATGTVHTDPSE